MQASCLQIYEGLIWWTEITKIHLATTGAHLFRGESIYTVLAETGVCVCESEKVRARVWKNVYVYCVHVWHILPWDRMTVGATALIIYCNQTMRFKKWTPYHTNFRQQQQQNCRRKYLINVYDVEIDSESRKKKYKFPTLIKIGLHHLPFVELHWVRAYGCCKVVNEKTSMCLQ